MSDESRRIADQASAYVAQSQHENPVQREQRERWLAADPRHRQEYAEQLAMATHISGISYDPELQADKTHLSRPRKRSDR